jgi:predicted secreted Zn-dependent protease
MNKTNFLDYLCMFLNVFREQVVVLARSVLNQGRTGFGGTGMTAKSDFQINTLCKLVLLVSLTFLGTEACADIYSYEDAGGTLVFTDNPAKATLKKRKVRRIPDEAKSAQPSTRTASIPATATNPQPARRETPEVRRQNYFYDIGGRTFMDIRREINRRSPKRINNKLAIAWCSWQVQFNIRTREKDNRCEITSADTSVSVAITMPRWVNYASAGVGMKEAWDLYSKSVLEHEETHASHGIAAAGEIQRRLPDMGGRTSCKNVREDGELLARRIISEHREKDVEMDRVSGDDFDTITDVEIAGDKREGALGRQYPARKNAPLR